MKRDPRWFKTAMELLDRFERRHESVIHIKLTLANLAKEVGVTRQTLNNNAKFHDRYTEVRGSLKKLGDQPLTAKRKERLTLEQRIRRLEKQNANLESQLTMANLRWMAVCRLAEREGWHGFEFKLRDLINPRDPRSVDTITKPEE
ncbi:hypothetical protein [Neptunomonas qingdaonensis]|uniref:Uncharacterized protein n=1 Tax=Neptunomonas qingdaonensis TaxID=1045558 RepID=A0A1I2RCG1_9GAMM|nr:hypothetical protein [Neptunomonas qingdaonensis]SFG37169.1 hypothetical protein SAMN05216175_10610 [Neptunomonas qingdaonensis]